MHPESQPKTPFIAEGALFLVAAMLALALGFFIPNPAQAETLFIDLAYPFLFALVGLTATFLLRYLFLQYRPSRKTLLNSANLTLSTVVILASLFLYTREGGSFKIPFDEQVLVNVSQNLDAYHQPLLSESTLGSLARTEMIDKRPLLFPFLLSLVHGILGYQSENAFFLNFAFTAVFLLLLFKTCERLSSRKTGYLAIALACCFPLLSQNASGAGFDLLNLCLILGTGLLAMDYWRNPNRNALLALLFLATATANVRYESPLILVTTAALVATVWIRDRSPSLPFAAAIIPFLFLPLAWQFRAIAASPERYQYLTDGAGSFNLSYLAENLTSAYHFLFIPDEYLAGSPFIAFLGLAGLLVCGMAAATRFSQLFTPAPNRIAFLFTAAFCLLQFALILCFYYGKLDISITSRLGLPFLLLLLITGSILLNLIWEKHRFGPSIACIVIALAAAYAFKLYSTQHYTRQNALLDKIDWSLAFAATQTQGTDLYVSPYGKAFEIEGYNNINLARFSLLPDKVAFHLDAKTYRNIFVIQPGFLTPTPNGYESHILPLYQLSPSFVLEPIEEVTFSAFNTLRLSKLVSIDPLQPDTAPTPSTPNSYKFYNPSDAEILRFNQNLL